MPLHTFSFKRGSQRGATLIELMVGITIGLLTVTVALGALMVSRGISGTVSEASQLQQQASYAFRVIGQQLRQAGSRQLDMNATNADPTSKIDLIKNNQNSEFIQGLDTPGDGEYALTITFQNVNELMTANDPTKNPVAGNQIRDCLQENPGSPNAPLTTSGTNDSPFIISKFKRDISKKSLVCAGTGAPQAIIENVNDFTIRYLIQNPSTAPNYRYVSAAGVTDWENVYAIQICLELEGTENIESVGSKYMKCDGSQAARENRLRMVFRNTFYIRNHEFKDKINLVEAT